jgi:hypothetical protein
MRRMRIRLRLRPDQQRGIIEAVSGVSLSIRAAAGEEKAVSDGNGAFQSLCLDFAVIICRRHCVTNIHGIYSLAL